MNTKLIDLIHIIDFNCLIAPYCETRLVGNALDSVRTEADNLTKKLKLN